MVENQKEFTINKPTQFDGNRKEVQSFLQDCKVYLKVNEHIYTTDSSKVAFILSFMNDKEAKRWKENYLNTITKDDEITFPTIKAFLTKVTEDFKPVNKEKDAAHQIAILRQGKKTAEETITEFRLLTNQAGYANETASDHMHLIGKLQSVLNTNLVKRVLLLDEVPTTIDKWAEKAIQIDSNYRQTMEVIERLTGERKNSKTTPNKPSGSSSNNSNNWRKKREEKDPDAMDIDTMTADKRTYLMKKGACFICEKPGHRAKDHDDFEQEEKKKNKGKSPQKTDIRAIHALFQGLSKAEKQELLALSTKEQEEEDKTEEEDF